MSRHTFSFSGGEQLTTMGAGWFVSYAFYKYEDKTHFNWKNVKTYSNRISVFQRTLQLHNYWLRQVLNMDDENLERGSKHGLMSAQIKQMAKILLEKLQKEKK